MRAHRHAAFDAALRAELLALNSVGADELQRAALAANALALASARLIGELLQGAGIAATGDPCWSRISTESHGTGVPTEPTMPAALKVVMLEDSVMP